MAANWKKKFRLKIITPNGIFFNNDVAIITAKTSEGYIGILYNHIPVVASIQISELHIGEIGSNSYYECAISGGLLCVEKDNVTIITDAIEYKKDIDLNRAKLAVKAAQQLLKRYSGSNDSIEFKAQFALHKALNRIRLKNKEK